jgi:hypothetical protein
MLDIIMDEDDEGKYMRKI